jgi:N-methylhydantoinase A
VALVRSFDCGYRHKSEIGGFPVRMAVLDINTVGAGGGSIAWFDKDELLKVGPRSAGADPGPACYGLGGVEPTVTDANLVLGRLPSIGLLGGSMQLSADRAREAVAKVSKPLGLSVEQGAIGILDIVGSNMVRAIRAITVERGFDPRELSLLAFGGAGPLHARQVAIALGVREIIVPTLPGILCAQGALASKFKEDLVRTVRQELRTSTDLQVLEHAIDSLLEDAGRWSRLEGMSSAPQDVSVIIEMRYVGQNFELTVPLHENEVRHLPSIDTLRTRFFEQHDQQYGFHSSDGVIEAVNIRLTVEASPRQAGADPSSRKAERMGIPSGTREIWFDSAPASAPVYARSSLVPGQSIVGPAVVDQADTTTLLFPGDRLTVDDHRNLLIGVEA